MTTYNKILHDKPFVFVGQGTHKNPYKNVLKAKLYKAYNDLNKTSLRHATSNKKSGFVMLRHAKSWLDFKSDQVTISKMVSSTTNGGRIEQQLTCSFFIYF